jgi:hypothetical protein
VSVDHNCADRAGVAEKLNRRRKTLKPCLPIDSDAAVQRDLDIRNRPECVEDVTIEVRRHRPPGTHAAQANPAGWDPAVGVQEARLWTLGEGDGSAYLRQALGDAENDVLLTKDKARRADETVQLAVSSQDVNAPTAEGEPAGAAVR